MFESLDQTHNNITPHIDRFSLQHETISLQWFIKKNQLVVLAFHME